MKVFISWSGELSREIAEALRVWLPAVLQAVKPYYTPDDIEKGARWSSEIANELEKSKVGIFCLTRENLQSSWILFEAGAISKVVGKGAVCPILFGLDNSDISGPLGQFQSTLFTKKEFFKLVKSINVELGDSKLPDDTLNSVFDMWWPKLEAQVIGILSSHKEKQPVELRSEREILEEILGLVRIISKSNSSQKITARGGIGKSSLLRSLFEEESKNELDLERERFDLEREIEFARQRLAENLKKEKLKKTIEDLSDDEDPEN